MCSVRDADRVLRSTLDMGGDPRAFKGRLALCRDLPAPLFLQHSPQPRGWSVTLPGAEQVSGGTAEFPLLSQHPWPRAPSPSGSASICVISAHCPRKHGRCLLLPLHSV